MAGPEVRGGSGSSAATASCLTFDGPDPKRPSPGIRSLGMERCSALKYASSLVSEGRRPGGLANPEYHAGMADPRLSKRVANITESSTLAIDAKAKALKAAGENIIGFGAGEPDFPTPRAHRRGRRASAPTPSITTTPRPQGSPNLRAAIADEDRHATPAIEVTPDQRARLERRQARPLQRVPVDDRPRRRGASSPPPTGSATRR